MVEILVTVGTTRFDELIATVLTDTVLDTIREAFGCTKLVLQYGSGQAPNPHRIASALADHRIQIDAFAFTDSLIRYIRAASIVIGHAGAGTTLEVLGEERPLFVVVNERLHDNHQLELAERLKADGHLFFCTPPELNQTLWSSDMHRLKPWKPGNPRVFGDWLDSYMGVKND